MGKCLESSFNVAGSLSLSLVSHPPHIPHSPFIPHPPLLSHPPHNPVQLEARAARSRAAMEVKAAALTAHTTKVLFYCDALPSII